MSEAPSIKEALEPFARIPLAHTDDIGDEATVFEYEGGCITLGDLRRVHAALATLQPSGERREAIARVLEPQAWAALGIGDILVYKNRRTSSLRKADRLLASGLVQDEAGEPTTAMIDAGVAFALSVSLSGEYRWSQYVADLYKTMRAAAIRSARDGGGS